LSGFCLRFFWVRLAIKRERTEERGERERFQSIDYMDLQGITVFMNSNLCALILPELKPSSVMPKRDSLVVFSSAG